MNELIDNYEQDIYFTMGHAGTGKSTLLAENTDEETIVLTPTHKAKEVLEGKGLAQVFTIHSVLKLVPTIDMEFRKKGKLQKLRRLGEVDLSTIKTIVIDEFSMIPMHIMDMLLEVLPDKAEVYIYGDPYQLPPVDGDPVDPYFYTREDRIHTLTKQYRSDAPEVVETFTRFVNYLEKPGFNSNLMMNPKIKQGNLDNFNPDTDRALAFTNAKTIEVNTTIAKKLGLPKEISIDEEVTINGLLCTVVERHTDEEYPLTIYPKCVSKGRLMQGQKLIDTINKIEEDMRKYRQRIPVSELMYVEIDGEVYGIHADINHYKHATKFKRDVEDTQLELIGVHELPEDIVLAEWCKQNRGAEGVRERGKAWSTYLAHQSLSWDMRRPFCTTVHKSQGSEFSTVYIAQEDIKKSIRGLDYSQYARLMYVALSRAINKVVVI